MMPNIVAKPDSLPLIFNNVTDKAIALKKNFIVGIAVEIEEILEEPETDETPSVRKIEQASNEISNNSGKKCTLRFQYI